LCEQPGWRIDRAAARDLTANSGRWPAPSTDGRRVGGCRGLVSSTGSRSGCTGTRARTRGHTSTPATPVKPRRSIRRRADRRLAATARARARVRVGGPPLQRAARQLGAGSP
jgi:hypothetical protein